MQKFKEIFTGILLFAIGIGWGNRWTTEILSCPEWWFIGELALLTGCGIALIRFLHGSWRMTLPPLLLMLTLPLPNGDLQSVLIPVLFGMWYFSEETLSSQWRVSRTFCGGLLIGGVIAGVFPQLPWIMPAVAVLSLLLAGIRISTLFFWEMVLLSEVVIFIACPFSPPEAPPEKIEPGTVLCAYSLVPEKAEGIRRHRVIFVGGEERYIFSSANELYPICYLSFIPELPGAVPEKSDLIIVSSLPETGDNGAAALLRALRPGGVLVLPRTLVHILPQLSWHILPGSAGNYAAASPERELDTNPEKMDRQLMAHFRNAPNHAPAGGVLSGLLIDFKSQQLPLIIPEVKKDFLRHLIPVVIAGWILIISAFRNVCQKRMEKFRIVLNCAGYTMLAALTVPMIFSGLPAVPSLRTLVCAVALMWFFRRPYARKKNHIWFAGLLSLIALAAVWSGSWIFAAAALVFGGYTFAVLDGELCWKDEPFTAEPLRFLAVALGAYAAYWMQRKNLPPYMLFSAVALMRFWSWFRS